MIFRAHIYTFRTRSFTHSTEDYTHAYTLYIIYIYSYCTVRVYGIRLGSIHIYYYYYIRVNIYYVYI